MTETGLDYARAGQMPLRACHTPFTQTSETYMIRWRARVRQIWMCATRGRQPFCQERAAGLADGLARGPQVERCAPLAC